MTYRADDDEPTIDPVTSVTAGSRDDALLVPTLSIQWHPDTARIGETCPILQAVGASIEVTRRAPLFRSEDGRQQPLNESSVSGAGKPSLTLVTVGDLAVELRPGMVNYPVVVNGVPLNTARRFGPSDLQDGVVILIGKSVLLYLSLMRHPRPPANPLPGIIGIGDRICDLRERVSIIANRTSPVLILGESGAGKGVFAEALHRASARAQKRFVPYHLGKALAEAVVTGELFGYERGSFTGAVEKNEGIFVEAHGGTLFLDEIGDAPPGVQTTLLKVLEDGQVWSVGSRRSRPVDVRIVAATDSDLLTRVTTGGFSKQLYGRINREEIVVPPIRQRREDVGPLLLYALQNEVAKCGLGPLLELPADPTQAPWLRADAVAEFLLLAPVFPFHVRTIETIANRLVTSAIGRSRAHPDATIEWLRTQPNFHDPIRNGPSQSHLDSQQPNTSMTEEEMARLWEDCGRSMAQFIKRTKIPRSTARRHIQDNRLIPKDSEISDEDILRALQEASGDVARAAAALGLSEHRFKQRLAAGRSQKQ